VPTLSLKEAIRLLPKTDLHCHLDGSLRPETVLDIANEERIDIGATDIGTLRKKLVCGEKVTDLPQFLQAFDITCAVLQSKKAIERVAFELAEDAFLEGVRYIEVRYSPILMMNKGLTMDEAIHAVYLGLQRAQKKYTIRATQIICALRVLDPKVSFELAQAAIRNKKYDVVGFDLAHAEKGNLPSVHAAAFRAARQAGLHATVHAGEAAGPDSILDAINSCKAERLGHGLTLHEDRGLEERVKRENITVECCPSSNVQISLIREFQNHPIKGYLQRGVPATLNTDNRLLTGITVSDEYARAYEHLQLSWSQLVTLAENGFKAAFVNEAEKKNLLDEFHSKSSTIAFN